MNLGLSRALDFRARILPVVRRLAATDREPAFLRPANGSSSMDSEGLDCRRVLELGAAALATALFSVHIVQVRFLLFRMRAKLQQCMCTSSNNNILTQTTTIPALFNGRTIDLASNTFIFVLSCKFFIACLVRFVQLTRLFWNVSCADTMMADSWLCVYKFDNLRC